MPSELEPDEVLEFLEDFIEEHQLGENQQIGTLLELLEDLESQI